LYKIVGLTPDVPYDDLREPSRAVFYVPFDEIDEQSAPRVVDFATFVIHSDAQNTVALADSLRQLIAQRHKGLRVSNITTHLPHPSHCRARRRYGVRLLCAHGAAALRDGTLGRAQLLRPPAAPRDRYPHGDLFDSGLHLAPCDSRCLHEHRAWRLRGRRAGIR